jgi:hypothetical protein
MCDNLFYRTIAEYSSTVYQYEFSQQTQPYFVYEYHFFLKKMDIVSGYSIAAYQYSTAVQYYHSTR